MLLDKITGKVDSPQTPDESIRKRLERGREEMRKGSSRRRVCFRFFRGDQYHWVNEKNQISFLPTITYTTGGGKEPHRVRQTRNYFKGIIESKVSQATNATPGFQVTPTTTDPGAASAAKTAEKVAYYGYDAWNLRRARVKAVTNALVADGGYLMPYFDPDVGPYHQQPDGSHVGEGQVKLLVLNGNQVTWEPGVDFDESPWHAIIRARPIGEVTNASNYTGGTLSADAQTSDVPTDRPAKDMVLVTEYFERPTAKTPRGRKLTIANDKLIASPEDYPLVDPDGNVCDEPVIHQLVYTLDPDSDRDMGLGQHLLDPQRTINTCISKEVEWMQRCLNPQMTAKQGSLKRNQQLDDAPGRVIYWRGNPGDEPKWQPTPAIPGELFEMVQQAVSDMRVIAADPDYSHLHTSAAAVYQYLSQQAQQQWQTFLTDLAETDSRVMRHCLYLVARFYTEPRLLELKGQWDWDNIQDFKGADLLGQCSVRVDPSTLKARGQDEVKADIQFWQQNFPGSIPFEAAAAAYYGGTAENMILDYRLDIQRAVEIIRAIQAGPDVLFNMPPQARTEPDAQGQLQMVEVPWWMPGPSDNVRVWKQIIGSFMKTTGFAELEAGMKAAVNEIYNGILDLEMRQAIRQQQMQTQMAQQLGMANAASPQGSALPSAPAVANQAVSANGSQQ